MNRDLKPVTNDRYIFCLNHVPIKCGIYEFILCELKSKLKITNYYNNLIYFEILDEIMPDHVHLLLDVNP